MTAAAGLERAYRLLLRSYPALYRHRHEEEILGVLMAAAQSGQRRPGVRESADLLWSALKIRIRMATRRVTGNVTDALTAGPVPALILAALVCLGWRRAAAVLAAGVPLAFLGISLTNGYTLLAGPRGDVTVYAYGLEALVLLITPSQPRGWRALRWRPAALLAAATVAAGIGMNGGLRLLLQGRPANLISPPLPGPAGNTLSAAPLLLTLLAAMVFTLGRSAPAGPDAPSQPASPRDT